MTIQTAVPQFDFSVQNHGTLVSLWALTEAAQSWVEEHLPADRLTRGKFVTVVEPRYIDNIIDGIRDDGLEIDA